MNRFRVSVAALCVASLFGLAAVALARADDKKEKGKPKDAAILDDATGKVTETAGGKEKTTTLGLKYGLKVKGYFNKDGFNIEEVDPDGPAARLMDDGGNRVAGMEKGDIIVEVDGKPVKSAKDYAKAMNGAADHAKVKLKVKDVNTGNDQEFYAAASKL
jgi:S1-C subfamily serine protease